MPPMIDRVGQRYGHLVVLRRGDNNGRRLRWLCRCDCGREVQVDAHALKSGNTGSCGCFARGVKDETGKRYGRLVVMGAAPVESRRGQRGGYQGAMWRCRCDCGREIVTRGASLRHGTSTSCGCVNRSRLGDRQRLPNGHSARNQALRAIKRAAALRGIAWELADAEAFALMESPCHYCGSPPANTSSHPQLNGEFVYSGIDRVDNGAGYTPANTVPCCWECNYAKRDRTVGEFLGWALRVCRHSGTRIKGG